MIRLLPEIRPVVTQYIYSLCSITLDHSKDYLIPLSRIASAILRTVNEASL